MEKCGIVVFKTDTDYAKLLIELYHDDSSLEDVSGGLGDTRLKFHQAYIGVPAFGFRIVPESSLSEMQIVLAEREFSLADKIRMELVPGARVIRDLMTLRIGLCCKRLQELDKELRKRQPHKEEQKETKSTQAESPTTVKPVPLLLSWSDIFKALEMTNTPENQRRVKRLNDMNEGPIAFPKKGGQPKVNKSKLITWWNSLEERFSELEKKKSDTQQTVKDLHPYSRDSEVITEIHGHVKKRRIDHKK